MDDADVRVGDMMTKQEAIEKEIDDETDSV